MAVLQALPNPGYVFAGWLPGAGQTITGFQNTVTVTSPIVVYPKFQVARKINFVTDPPGLTVLADRTALDDADHARLGMGLRSHRRSQFAAAG